MPTLDKNEQFQLEILKHVEESPRLNNRMLATKLGCSVKLAHSLLKKMVDRGFLHVKKRHSRRWDYFLTPTGITEKAKLTYEFLDFSLFFYHEARRKSSQVCREIKESGKKTVGFIGAADLAEIVYLGVKEWNLELVDVFDDQKKTFLGHPVGAMERLPASTADVLVVCMYDPKFPMARGFLPENIAPLPRMRWLFCS